jgi:hypothetical protein
MLEFAVNPVAEKCPFCQDPREVVFSYTDDVVSVKGASYHHENGEILRFARDLRVLEQRRAGRACLVSKAEDSEFIVWFARTGGELRFSARHMIRSGAEADLEESVSYFGEVPSEHVGKFVGEWIGKIEMCQSGRREDCPPGSHTT